MFNIIYKKENGEIYNITTATNETVLSNYETDVYAAIQVDNVPQVNPLRQQLLVSNGQLSVVNHTLTAKQELEIQIIESNQIIDTLKANLTSTDYKAIKFAEGLISDAEYLATKQEREAWRNQINTLETTVSSLVAQLKAL